MTVLLIDACGNRRQYEIPQFTRWIHVPIPVSISLSIDAIHKYEPPPVAVFEYSDEESYPPVYRQKL